MPFMATASRPLFLHSYKVDGCITSICSQCQVTVATELNEIDLRRSESLHVCSALDVGSLLRPEDREEIPARSHLDRVTMRKR